MSILERTARSADRIDLMSVEALAPPGHNG
jgi:hypothetical protein